LKGKRGKREGRDGRKGTSSAILARLAIFSATSRNPQVSLRETEFERDAIRGFVVGQCLRRPGFVKGNLEWEGGKKDI